MDKANLSRHLSSSNLLDTLFEDIPQDDKICGPVKDEEDRCFKDKEGPECTMDASPPWWKVHRY